MRRAATPPVPTVRAQIARALGEYPECTEYFLPLLSKALDHEDDEETETDIRDSLEKLRSAIREG